MSGRIDITGLLRDRSSLQAWTERSRQRIRQTVKREMVAAQPDLQAAAQGAVRGAFRVSKASFPAAWRTRVYASKPNRLPALLIQSRVFWMGAQEYGVRIIGRNGVLIPFGNLRIGYQAFRGLLATLRENGQGFFRNVGGRVILFARARVGLKGGAVLRLKRAFAASRSSTRGVRQGDAFPVATLVPRVQLRPRFSLERAAAPAVGRLARRIEQAVDF